MSNQEEQMAETRPRIITGFIHVGESDDSTELFNVINEFRKNNGLKYSHQAKAHMVFFNISSEHLDAFSKVRPFKISRFQTRTEYTCDKETCDKLMKQKDSFLRMLWDETTNVLTFMSRTPSRVHGNLVRRIFKDSEVEFQRDNYSVTRNFNSGGDDQEHEHEPDHEFTQNETHEGFQRVEKKSKPSNPKPKTTFTTSKIVKESESKPKIRGSTKKAPKTNA